MARSLTVQHEEHVGTSPLLTGFLLFAALWLAVGAAFSWSADAQETAPLEAPAE